MLAGRREFGGRSVGWWERARSARRFPAPPSGWEWHVSQSGQGATDLLTPRPAPGQMQGEAACRAGEPSGDREEPPPLTQSIWRLADRKQQC